MPINTTLYSLSLKFQLSESPYIIIPLSSSFQNIYVKKSRFFNFFSGFYFQGSDRVSSSFHESHFTKFLKSVISINSFQKVYFKTRQNFSTSNNSLSIKLCWFEKIKTTQTNSFASSGCLYCNLPKSLIEIRIKYQKNCIFFSDCFKLF